MAQNIQIYEDILDKLDGFIGESEKATDCRLLCLTLEEAKVLRNHLFNALQDKSNS